MRTKILIITIILSSFKVSNCQTWAPIAAIWTYTETFASSSAVNYNIIESVKDTIINLKNCKKLHFLKWTCNTFSQNEFMYEDSNRVYFYDAFWNKFNLLYDFNKLPGESWFIRVNNCSGGDNDSLMVHVDSISTILINGYSLKVLHTRIDNGGIWVGFNGRIIEKIGHEKDMFPFVSGLCDENFNNGLRCYDDTIIGMYQTGLASRCDFSTVGINNYFSKNEFTIYPNPTSNDITLEFQQPASIEISNIQGQLIKAIIASGNKTNIDHVGCSSYEVNVSALQSGVYVVKVKTEKGVLVKKFVKE